MQQILALFILIPLLGLIINYFISSKSEKALFYAAITTIAIHLVTFFGFLVQWLISGSKPVQYQFLTLYKSTDFRFDLSFYFDNVSAVYMCVASLLVFLVGIFSRYYLHRDQGFKRFFNTLLLFYLALNLIIFSGNFETIFMGWEVMGITSFLLIAFYRDRFLPAKNALKVLSVYRLGDVGLLLGIWLSHYLWHENITFFKLNNSQFVAEHINNNYLMSFLIALMFFLAAAIKSAQVPFSSWLPRAMEGPTTSSAIFYGSLSVHLGVFLLLRTYPFWGEMVVLKIAVALMGLTTAILCTATANVQATAKTQIAYSSIVQIGIIFIEVALGWHTLALVHFAGNAFLRTYQLLVSPSVLGYMIHDQVFNYEPKPAKSHENLAQKIRNTLYVLGLKEWNLDFFQYRYLWQPFKWIGNRFNFMSAKLGFACIIAVFALGVGAYLEQSHLSPSIYNVLKIVYPFIGMLLVIRAFVHRGDARIAWVLLLISQFFMALSIAINEYVVMSELITFLSGAVVCAVVGYVCLSKIKNIENDIQLNGFHGHIYEHPKIGFAFLVCALGLVGFPFTPTFLGIDLMFSHLHPSQIVPTACTAIGFIFIEISVLRIYARLFLGQHIKKYHEIAYRSS